MKIWSKRVITLECLAENAELLDESKLNGMTSKTLRATLTMMKMVKKRKKSVKRKKPKRQFQACQLEDVAVDHQELRRDLLDAHLKKEKTQIKLYLRSTPSSLTFLGPSERLYATKRGHACMQMKRRPKMRSKPNSNKKHTMVKAWNDKVIMLGTKPLHRQSKGMVPVLELHQLKSEMTSEMTKSPRWRTYKTQV